MIEASLTGNNQTRHKRQLDIVAPRWPGNRLYYSFDASINARFRKIVKQALDFISSRTCITFTQDATAPDRVRVFSGSGCWSSIGMIGGVQDLSLGKGCDQLNVVLLPVSMLPPGCGEILVATAAWKKKTFTFGNAAVKTHRDLYMKCHHWIRAPGGRQVQVRVTATKNVQCGVGCRDLLPGTTKPGDY
ncbi:astacin [Teladorsagia circumcincta]|uniref:Astacin n=1 Tax=Teladorsagia circumcincta TaxID=45464 RepID=A0A2G9UG05_TELCI|nr:astacin [Teladorsagia circumcincta]